MLHTLLRTQLTATPTTVLPHLTNQVRSVKLRVGRYTRLILLTFGLVCCLFLIAFPTHTATASSHSSCQWYRIRWGDTLSDIASTYRMDIWTLARANRIANVNRIFAYQTLCIPTTTTQRGPNSGSPQPIGHVSTQLRHSASRYGLPPNLILAIAWEESRWQQNVVSPAGAIGVMQVMPSTATWINSVTNSHYNVYILQDNIHMGTFYLHWLWQYFHGDLIKVISAYNEGPGNVTSRGIFNWQYVNNVLATMNRLH